MDVSYLYYPSSSHLLFEFISPFLGLADGRAVANELHQQQQQQQEMWVAAAAAAAASNPFMAMQRQFPGFFPNPIYWNNQQHQHLYQHQWPPVPTTAIFNPAILTHHVPPPPPSAAAAAVDQSPPPSPGDDSRSSQSPPPEVATSLDLRVKLSSRNSSNGSD